MLIRFSVENFRSFKDRQSLYLNSVKTCKEWIDENTAVESDVRIVRSAVIYGANASGKTNLLIAMLRMKAFMLSSVDIDKNPNFLLAEPFLLCSGNFN
ncbi:MAG: ATP-binding protein, partial [Kiritimatiellae bacterium]|nr:ATP-binding protein [Kiritimatiellia bacterium]